MTKYALGAAIFAAGFLAFAAPPFSRADDPPPTVTVVETVTVDRTYQGLNVRQWARKTVRARRDANQQHRDSAARGQTIEKLRRESRHRWAPTVDYALRLAAAAYAPFGGPSYAKLRAVAFCESTLNPFARNGKYLGLFQKHWSPFGQFSVNDPVADALDTAATVVHDGSWRQWECG